MPIIPQLDQKTLEAEYKYLNWFLTAKRVDVLNYFHSFLGAFSDGEDNLYKRFVYIKGTRPDAVLLVAHVDTVWHNIGIKTKLDGQNGQNIISDQKDIDWSINYKNGSKVKRKGIGIQADDRAGCAILDRLKDLGHSLLLVNGEEIGCVGSKWLMETDFWKKEVNSHSFVIEFDRRDSNDIVFYDVGTNEFVNYVKEETGYTPESGTFTDIRVLCEDICGVNISVGYYNEHTQDERLNIPEWINTLNVTRKMLSKPLKKFKLNNEDKFEIPHKVKHFGFVGGNLGQFRGYDNYKRNKHYKHRTLIDLQSKNEFLQDLGENSKPKIRCKHCHDILNFDDIFLTQFICTKCQTSL